MVHSTFTGFLDKCLWGGWRLNEMMLGDQITVDRLTQSLTDFFTLNTTEDVPLGTVWAVLRGKHIHLSLLKKQEKESHIESLIVSIKDLEKAQRVSRDPTGLERLSTLRTELKSTLALSTDKAIRFTKRK